MARIVSLFMVFLHFIEGQLLKNDIFKGGLAVAIIVYLLSATLQAIGIYKIAKKEDFPLWQRCLFVAITYALPFGVEVALLTIGFKARKKTRRDHRNKVQHDA